MSRNLIKFAMKAAAPSCCRPERRHTHEFLDRVALLVEDVVHEHAACTHAIRSLLSLGTHCCLL